MHVPLLVRRFRRTHLPVAAVAALALFAGASSAWADVVEPPATTPVATTPPVVPTTPTAQLPQIVNITPPALFARVGYPLRIRGSKLQGTRYITIGTKRVKPLLVLSASELWLIAPGLRAGTYPVSVTTREGTSPASDAAVLTYYASYTPPAVTPPPSDS